MKASEYLDQLAAHLAEDGKPLTDYKLSQRLGTAPQVIYRYRKDQGHFGRDTAIKVAHLLGIDPGVIYLDIQIEGSKSPEEKRIWKSLAKRLGRAAAVTMPTILTAYLMIGMLFSPYSQASERQETGARIYIMLNRCRRWWAALGLRHHPNAQGVVA